MDQLIHNRYFKHPHVNSVIKSVMAQDDDGKYCLYVDLYDGEEIVGATNKFQKRYMVASHMIIDDWNNLLNSFIETNGYEEFNPFKMEAQEAVNFIQKCRSMMQQYNGLRLGQTIINELGEKTPTPNIKIFNSLDENEVLTWFYENYAS